MNSKQAYLELVAKRKQEKTDKGEVLELPMPSGAVWQYLPFKVQQYALGGRLPMHLIAKLESVKNMPEDERAKNISQKDLFDAGMSMMEVTRDIMLNNLVFPKITLEETDDSITPEMIDPEDFDFFMNFVRDGGQSQQNSFRKPIVKGRKRAA